MPASLIRLGTWLYARAENLLAAMLAVMFAVFILQIVFRYLLNLPIGWTHEISVVMWLWMVLFGTAFAAPAVCVMTAFLLGVLTGRTGFFTFLFGFLFAGAFAVAGFAVLLGATYEATGSLFNLYTLAMLTPILVAPLIAMSFYLMKAPTVQGRKVMDEIEGFKQYLGVAEEDRLNYLHPPEKTPELFERYLPYAVALGLVAVWVVARSVPGRAQDLAGPGWEEALAAVREPAPAA